MPIHDWSLTPGWLWHQMQLGWSLALSDACNRLLPSGYYALIEYAAAPPDSPLSFDIPDAAFEGLDDESFAAAKRRSVAVRRSKDHRKIALIEVLGPADNHAGSRANFATKAKALFDRGIHLLVIDPFPPTKRDPNGVHGAIWERMTEREFAQPADRPLTAAAYCSGEELTAFVDPLAVGEAWPDKPLFLDAERYVSVPLEATYQAAWQTFPREWQNVITNGGA